MFAGEILDKVKGLTRDKLAYFVNAGYVKPKKVKRGTLYYNQFSEKDFLIIKCAWKYIKKHMRVRSAFERAVKEYEQGKLS